MVFFFEKGDDDKILYDFSSIYILSHIFNIFIFVQLNLYGLKIEGIKKKGLI